MSIYTKKGDKGRTSTIKGKMSKSDELAWCLGTIDELNSWIGVCRDELKPDDKKTDLVLKNIQTNLMTINAMLAGGKMELGIRETKKLEVVIDRTEEKLPKLTNFIYPRGNLQVARAVCRRAERWVAEYFEIQEGEMGAVKRKRIQQYINRLSDTLFVLARQENSQKQVIEEVWKL